MHSIWLCRWRRTAKILPAPGRQDGQPRHAQYLRPAGRRRGEALPGTAEDEGNLQGGARLHPDPEQGEEYFPAVARGEELGRPAGGPDRPLPQGEGDRDPESFKFYMEKARKVGDPKSQKLLLSPRRKRHEFLLDNILQVRFPAADVGWRTPSSTTSTSITGCDARPDTPASAQALSTAPISSAPALRPRAGRSCP